ncbi:MAG: HDIG domain-containing protein [Lachnospiraceae bacterium]|nr:HDIG domain-containing protein [Lachnospiraceae bacterium]
MNNEYNLNKNIKINVPDAVRIIIKILESNGYEAYAVGGCVRDTILGRKPQDWDITTSALPLQVKELFHKTIDTGLQHGTVTVMIKGVGYEVTTYRIDGEYTDSRHPDSVEFTSNLIEDLKRRDFTINAMAYNPNCGLVDAFEGIEDIKKCVIKCVGDGRERFTEDALRILRAVRFSAQLGFEIEEKTAAAAKELAPTLVNISQERICAELEKLIKSDHPQMLETAYNLGITKWILPEFDKMMECEQNTKYHMYNVGIHTIKVMQKVRPEHYIRWAALLHDIGKPDSKTTDKEGSDHFYNHGRNGKELARSVMRRLRLDNRTIGIVTRLVECHDLIIDIKETEVSVRRSIHDIGNDIYPMFLELIQADSDGKSQLAIEHNQGHIDYVRDTYNRIIERGDCYCTKMLALAGRDVIRLGVEPGPGVGDVLDELLEMVLDNPKLNTKEQLEEIVIRIKNKMK